MAGGDLEGKAIASIADLQYASPSVSIGDSGLTNAVNIRGVGLASGSPAVANGVATYVGDLDNDNYYFYGPPRQFGTHIRYQF
jgi:iron complex outermembrane receptor protein